MKAPWHLWAVGLVSLLWNGFGAFDFTMTATRNPSYMGAFTPEQLDYFYSFPIVAVLFWALGVWAAVLGSLLLLLRNRHAFLAFVAALIGLVGTTWYAHGVAVVPEGAGGSGALIMTAVIAVVTLLLAWYARRMTASGVLV
jgi:hypothetical protein